MSRNTIFDENPRFDLTTGRPYLLNCLEHVLVFTREYLDNEDITASVGMKGLQKLADNSRVGTKMELLEYLAEDTE